LQNQIQQHLRALNSTKLQYFEKHSSQRKEAQIAVSIETRLKAGGARNHDMTPGRGNRLLFSPQNPNKLQGPPSLIYNG
jgi:hypothetical protein